MNEPKKKYHVLARGVITSAEYILVAHCIGMDNTFLPGGHVEFNEGIKTSLEREIQEELGLESQVGQYLGLVEADFELPDPYHQEINHLFTVSISELNHTYNPVSKEKHLEFYWVHVNEMENHNLQPYHVRTIIKDHMNKTLKGPYFLSTFDETNR